MARKMIVTCPQCGSTNVELDECAHFAWLHCRDCGYRWENEAEEEAHKRHKRKESAE
jgi:transcription elongation factor Elf1